MAAIWAAEAGEAVGQNSAAEIAAKLALDEAGVAYAVCAHARLLEESLEVVLHETVQGCALGTTALVANRVERVRTGKSGARVALEGDGRSRSR